MADSTIRVNDKDVLAIIQGGMGVAISGPKLTAAMAALGAIGTFAGSGLTEEQLRAGLRETFAILEEQFPGRSYPGIVLVNLMGRLTNYDALVDAALEEGADGITSGAGLLRHMPKKCRELGKAFIPVVGSERVAEFYLNLEVDRLAAEGHEAGGHLSEDSIKKTLPGIARLVHENGAKVFGGGGVHDFLSAFELLQLGADGLQVGTRYAVTVECDAHENWKQAIVNAREEDIVIIESPVGMDFRAIKNPFVDEVLSGKTFRELSKEFESVTCESCLKSCKRQKYCILHALIRAKEGEVETGLITCGEDAADIHEILTVQEVTSDLLLAFAS